MTLDQMMLQLDKFGFWNLKTLNAGECPTRYQRGTIRRYECEIFHAHHRYRATGRTIADAISLCMEKANCGHTGRLPKLKLTR